MKALYLYAEHHVSFIFMLSVIVLNVIMLSTGGVSFFFTSVKLDKIFGFYGSQ